MISSLWSRNREGKLPHSGALTAASRRLRRELGHQLPDFGFLGEEEVRGGRLLLDSGNWKVERPDNRRLAHRLFGCHKCVLRPQ